MATTFQNWRWRDGPVGPGRAVVFDLDGVLSDAASRQHYLEGPWRDWDAFFESCGEDPLIEEGAQMLGLPRPPGLGAAATPGLAAPVPAALGPVGDAGPRRLRRGTRVQAALGSGVASR